MIRRPPRSTLSSSSAASDVYKRQPPSAPETPTEATNRNASRPSSADAREGAIEMSPSHAETTHALLELLFVACTRMMRYRRTVSMRVGLHIGEVYGTLIGSSQVSFEFVGETISTAVAISPVSYTHLRAHETPEHLVCRLLLEKKKKKQYI
eukprot:TRINITY_DN7044_c0_g1_i3.p1 TRINITY_DN7044_c0_g1~~TRINITY_DN7044_c0_g1_i3.p1  ORF type:complete len:152 (+),score=49.53 TRINITY_DN7044_c0_g1_i3:131-586(+)